MKRQSQIENFFKMKANIPSTPKTPKLEPNLEPNVTGDVVILCSDSSDDDIWEKSTQQKKYGKKQAKTNENQHCIDLSQVSTTSTDSSQTILYELTPEEPKTPAKITPLSKAGTSNYLVHSSSGSSHAVTVEQRTPQKTPSSTTSSAKTPHSSRTKSLSGSPSFTQKYFSPAKNRNVIQRTPAKVKRNLSAELESAHLLNLVKHEQFAIACQDMDDKTIYLLTIINDFIQTTSLHHLLDLEQHAMLNNCLHVVKPGMRLVCRLYWRKEGWYKREQARQIATIDGKDALDDPKFQEMIECLIANGLIEQGDSNNIDYEDFMSILTKNELIQVCKELNLKANSKKDAVEALASFGKQKTNISHYFKGSTTSNSKRVLQLLSIAAGPCYKLSGALRKTLFRLYIIMYLGMKYDVIRTKQLELTLLYDEIQRETYPIEANVVIDNASVVFKTRDAFERYITSHILFEEFLIETSVSSKNDMAKRVFHMYQEIDADEMSRCSTMPQWLRRFTAGYVYVKLLESAVQDLKKDKNGAHYLLALNILTTLILQDVFRCHKKADWYSEKALILHRVYSRSDEAAEVLLEGLTSDLPEEAKDLMRPRARLIATQKNIQLSDHLKRALLEHAPKENILEHSLGGTHVHKQPMELSSNKRGKQRFETRTAEGRVVSDAEQTSIAHYLGTKEFTHGEHWEGSIVTTMFFLLFWEIIYTPPRDVPGIFLCRFQIYPLDLFTTQFYQNRRREIDSWLEIIENASLDKLLKIMLDTWNTRPERELSGIKRAIGWDNIRMVATCLGGPRLSAICRRLAQNYAYAHSGFPDLTLWHELERRIKFVEVKTDADTPSIKQIQWMQYLRQNGIECEFCYLGVNTTRQRSRAKKSQTQVS